MPVKLGEGITGLSFLRPDGSAVQVGDFAGKPLLLIFLRHLA